MDEFTVVAVSQIFTGCNEVVAKVMFLLVSVILSAREICLSACWDTAPQEGGTPQPRRPPCQGDTPFLPRPTPKGEIEEDQIQVPPGIRSMSGRYASYWNAFLFQLKCRCFQPYAFSSQKDGIVTMPIGMILMTSVTGNTWVLSLRK